MNIRELIDTFGASGFKGRRPGMKTKHKHPNAVLAKAKEIWADDAHFSLHLQREMDDEVPNLSVKEWGKLTITQQKNIAARMHLKASQRLRANRMKAKSLKASGTSEGAKLAWESRDRGTGEKETVPKSGLPAVVDHDAMHTRLKGILQVYDDRLKKRASKQYYNPFAAGLMDEALTDAMEEIKKGMPIEKAISRAFTENSSAFILKEFAKPVKLPKTVKAKPVVEKRAGYGDNEYPKADTEKGLNDYYNKKDRELREAIAHKDDRPTANTTSFFQNSTASKPTRQQKVDCLNRLLFSFLRSIGR